MESNIAQLVLGALHKKVFFASDIAANIGESERVTQGILDKLCESGKVVGEQVRNNIAYRLSDNPTAIELKVLKAIDDKYCTLPQIKRHAEIDRSFDLMPVLEAMIFDGLIVRRTNEAETLTAYFRKELIPPKFYLGENCVEGDWENAAPDDTEARMARARRKADELAFSPKENEEATEIVEKTKVLPRGGAFIAISPEDVRKYAALGQSRKEIAELIGIGFSTFEKKLKDFPALKENYEQGRAEFKAKSLKKEDTEIEISTPEKKKTRKPSPSPTRDKILANLANIQTWAQEGRTRGYAAERLGIHPTCFSKYFDSIPELVQHWEKGLELKKPSSPRGQISASLDLIEQYAFEGKCKSDVAEYFEITPGTFSNNYFYSIPGVKEAWKRGEERLKQQSRNQVLAELGDLRKDLRLEKDTGFDKVPVEEAKALVGEIIGGSLQTDYAKIPVTPEEDEAFEELSEKLNAKDVAHKLKLDEEASGDYVGQSLPTGLKHIVGDSAPGPVELDCPPNCGHTKEQHEVFDLGYKNGLEGITSPYIDPAIFGVLRNTFLSGYSVGLICYRDNLKDVWKKRGYDDAMSGKARQTWELKDFDPLIVESYTEGYEEGLKERDTLLVKAELKNEDFYDHRGENGDEIPQGDWKIIPASKTPKGEVEVDPRFANTVERLSSIGRSKEGFERKKQEFLESLPEIKIPDITRGATYILPDTIEPRPGNFKTLKFGNLTVRLAVEGNLFDAPKEVREKLEGLFDWAEKNAK